MSPAVKRNVGNVALTLVLVGLAGGVVAAWKRYGGLNPYGGLTSGKAANPMAEVQAEGVRLRQYHAGKLVAKAEAKTLTVGGNGTRVVLQGVHNGLSNTSQGPIQFAAGTGVLNPLTKVIEVSNGVRIKGGNDFDLTTSTATIKGAIGEVDVMHPLTGTLKGGKFTASSFVHRMNTDETRLTKVDWQGKPPQDVPAPSAVKDKVWHIHGDEYYKRGQTETTTNAWAADGEMIVTAPKMAHDLKADVVTATADGSVRATYRSAKADIVADKVVVYRNESRAVCTGHVLVYVRPKKDWDKPLPEVGDDDRGPQVPDVPPSLEAKLGSGGELTQAEKDKIGDLRSGKNLRDYPMQMAAEEVTYWYKEGERRAVAKGGSPTAFQKFDDGRWRQAWAPEAHYDGEKDMLDLIGPMSKREVHMRDSVSDNNDCFKATLSTKEDQTEDDEYVYMLKPKGHGTDFDADRPNAAPAKPGSAPAGTKPPVAAPPKGTGTPPPVGTPPPAKTVP